MLKWALLCLLTAIVAALAPAAGLAAPAQSAAKVLCFASLALFVVFVGLGGTRAGSSAGQRPVRSRVRAGSW